MSLFFVQYSLYNICFSRINCGKISLLDMSNVVYCNGVFWTIYAWNLYLVHLDIRYYRDPFSRELPTDISISMGMQEWECFLQKGIEIANKVKKKKKKSMTKMPLFKVTRKCFTKPNTFLCHPSKWQNCHENHLKTFEIITTF